MIRILVHPASLFLLGAVAEFAILAASNIFMSSAVFQTEAHGTTFVVVHVGHVKLIGLAFAFAAVYILWPILTHRTLDDRLGRLHFALTFLCFNFGAVALLSIVPEISLAATPGKLVLPGRWYLVEIATTVALVASQIPFVYNLVTSFRRTRCASINT